MNDVTKLLRQAGLSELACQFAAYIQRHDSSQDELVALTAGLVSDAVSQGHVCLNFLNDNTASSMGYTFDFQII